MSIETVSNEPKVETKAAPVADASQKAQAGMESPVADAKAPAESPSEDSGTTETEEVEGSEAETEESEPEKDPDSQDPASKEPTKKKSGFKRRVDRLTREKQELATRVQQLEQLVLKGAGSSNANTQAAPAKAASSEGEPQPDTFDTHAAYVKAVARWEAKQEFKEHSLKQAQSQLQTEQARQEQNYVEKAKEFSAKTPDFKEVVDDASDIPMSPTVRQAIIKHGPELAYELAKDREEFARICKLPAIDAAMEIGEVKAKLAIKSSPEKKPEQKTTKAPAPLAPVRGGGTASIPKTLEEAANSSFSEYKKLRAQEIKKRRQA